MWGYPEPFMPGYGGTSPTVPGSAASRIAPVAARARLRRGRMP